MKKRPFGGTLLSSSICGDILVGAPGLEPGSQQDSQGYQRIVRKPTSFTVFDFTHEFCLLQTLTLKVKSCAQSLAPLV
jgi:hypothetical protein